MEIRDDIMLYGKMAQQKLGYVAGQIEVTSACFQHCMHCKSWRDKGHNARLSLEQMIHIVVRNFFTCDFPVFEHLTLTGGDPQAWSPLDEFLGWWQRQDVDVDLQVSTALARDVKNPKLWRNAIKDLRVSIDAYDKACYQTIRGDKENTPKIIFNRLIELKHPNLAIIVTAYPKNINQILPLIATLDTFHQKGLSMRKIIVMAGIGVELDKKFWCRWKQTKNWAADYIKVPTSFAEGIIQVRALCNSPVVSHVRCWASKLGFHIKPNGDVYPCCLIGGEAIEVQREFKMGNIFELNLFDIYKRYQPTRYEMKPICREVCQFKQLQINLAGEYACKIKLAIP